MVASGVECKPIALPVKALLKLVILRNAETTRGVFATVKYTLSPEGREHVWLQRRGGEWNRVEGWKKRRYKKEAAPKGGFHILVFSFKPIGLELHACAHEDEVDIIIAGQSSII